MHSGSGLDDEPDRRAIASFDQALADIGLADERLRQVSHEYFAWATTTTTSCCHRSADDVADGLDIPHRSWDRRATLHSGSLFRHAVVRVWARRSYTWAMDVTVSTLRAELSSWIERAREGEEIVVTDRGTPVARLLAVGTAPLLDQLVARGVVSKPRRADRPAARRADRVHASGPVADLVSEQRR